MKLFEIDHRAVRAARKVAMRRPAAQVADALGFAYRGWQQRLAEQRVQKCRLACSPFGHHDDAEFPLIELRFDQLRPLGPVGSPRPPLERIDSLLLVIDTLNNRPGTAGEIKLTDLWLAR